MQIETKPPHIVIAKVRDGFSPIKLDIQASIVIKDYNNLDTKKFTPYEVLSGNRPNSNTVMVAVKDGIAHIVSKDPDIRVLIKNKGFDTTSVDQQFSSNTIYDNGLSTKKEPVIEIPKEEIKKEEVKEEPPKKEKKVSKKEKEKEKELELIPKTGRSTKEQIATIKKNIKYVLKSEVQHAGLIAGMSGGGKCLSGEEEIELEVSNEFYNHLINKGYINE